MTPGRHLGTRIVAALPAVWGWGFVIAFVLAPLAWLAASTVWSDGGLTTQAWRELMTSGTDWSQLARTLWFGVVATAIAAIAGAGHTWLTHDTDLPLGRWLAPLGVAPLVIPPIVVAMGFADFADITGFWPCAAILGVCYAPFVAVLTARGLRSVDGRMYESALLARGRQAADGLLLRLIAPEIAAGCLLAFVFVISEHGVPEFLTVKGKTWHTYAEGIFSRWTRRATGTTHADLVSPIIAAAPLVLVTAIALFAALRLRARATIAGDFRPLPRRSLGAWRWSATAIPIAYLTVGVVIPMVVMALWAAGSTQQNEPISVTTFLASMRTALQEAGSDLSYTGTIAIMTVLILIAVAIPLARQSARSNRAIDALSILPVAVPGILLSIGLVHVFNRPATGTFYDSAPMVACGYAARFLPFGILTLSHAVRRMSPDGEAAAQLTGRSPVARAWHIHLPLLAPAAWSAACLTAILALRELDVAVVLPAGNGTVVRRLSNVIHFGGEDMGGALALLLLFLATLLPAITWIVTGRKLRSLS